MPLSRRLWFTVSPLGIFLTHISDCAAHTSLRALAWVSPCCRYHVPQRLHHHAPPITGERHDDLCLIPGPLGRHVPSTSRDRLRWAQTALVEVFEHPVVI